MIRTAALTLRQGRELSTGSLERLHRACAEERNVLFNGRSASAKTSSGRLHSALLYPSWVSVEAGRKGIDDVIQKSVMRHPRMSVFCMNPMPKSSDPITASDLIGYLETTSDFQFEMEVLKVCTNSSFIPEHGGTYVDFATKKDRQFDIRAWSTKQQRGDQHCVLKLAIECKNLKSSFPLLVSCVPRREEECYHYVIMSPIKRTITGVGKTSSSVGSSSSSSTQHVSASSVTADSVKIGATQGSAFRHDQMVGKSVAQVGKSVTPPGRKDKGGEDPTVEFIGDSKEVYERWAQAVSSCYDLIKQAPNDHQTLGREFAVTVVQPILVVADDTLWTVGYWKDGRRIEDPTRVERADFYLGKSYQEMGLKGEYKLSHLIILTLSGLKNFLREFDTYGVEPGPGWNRFFPDLTIRDMKKVLESQLPFSIPISS